MARQAPQRQTSSRDVLPDDLLEPARAALEAFGLLRRHLGPEHFGDAVLADDAGHGQGRAVALVVRALR